MLMDMKRLNANLKIFGISFLLIAIVILSGCTDKSTSELAMDACVDLCRNAQINLTNGPCLSDRGPWNMSNWVCDVAHSPREAVDDMPENQCQAFENGTASFYVEVSPDCKLIRGNCCY
jgi:hypothetical protein